MRRSLLNLPAPEIFFGVFHTLVWLILVVQVSAGVVAPLAQVLGSQAISERVIN